MSRSLTRVLGQAARRHRPRMPSVTLTRPSTTPRVYLAGNVHERVAKVTLDRPLAEVLMQIQRHVRARLRRWKKADEQLSCRGPRIVVCYEHDFAESHILQPKSFWAQWNTRQELERTRRTALVKSVPYEVELWLTIEQHFPTPVTVGVRLAERIDPRGRLAEHPIGHHFWAPSAIHGEPWFDDLLAALRSYA